jgi:predicted AlkP superfamily phosphohydrolase/phosphomutase
MVLAVSPHGPEPPNRERSINEWLVLEGSLVLNDAVSSSEELNINWSKTKAWSEDGQVFFNVQGREPQGVIPAPDYESFRDEIKSRLEASKDEKGQPLNPLVFKPKEIYRNVRNLAPDLIVQFDPTSNGIFILTAPNCPLIGEYEGAHLLDIAPTLLDLAGYEIPETLQGRSLVAGLEKKTPTGGSSEDDKQILHDRLAGLGYI